MTHECDISTFNSGQSGPTFLNVAIIKVMPGIKFKSQNSKVKTTSKKLKLVILFLFGFCFLRFGALVNAQIPSPAPIPCSDTGNPEFHSLRPYQASPCQTKMESPAKFCGNDLTLHDTITEYYPGGGGCVPNGGEITCTYSQLVTKPITIDMSGATLPFMGNTEDVLNSQSSTDSLGPADKMNNYVSWYLNGVENRAENGTSENTDANVVNFSGPLNKLLPGAILDAQRIKTITNAAGSTDCVVKNPNACNQKVCAANGTSYCCPDSAACTQLQNTTLTNHDQIVVCAKSNLGILGDITGLGSFTAKECYQGNGSVAQSPVFRLSHSGCTGPGECDGWDGELSLFNKWMDKIVDALTVFFPGQTRDWIRQHIGNQWNLRTPPLPWDDGTGHPFATEDLYTKAYNEWRGNTCVLIPVINKVVCFNNILVPDKYADLYSYVPLSSTEDLKGSLSIDNVSSAAGPAVGGVSVTGVGFSNQTPSTLFFPHMQESSDLASLLQNTFVASSEAKNKTASPTNTSTAPVCNTVEVRSNKGDTIAFPPQSSLAGTLSYTAAFSCDFETEDQMIKEGKCTVVAKYYECPVQSCTKDIYVSLSTTGSIPKANDLWSQLVAGPESIFKKIFPKTNTTGSVGTITDIPGSTNITYSGSNISQETADLKFPHIGGISEYFLKGIQTALRPKGYGSPIAFSPTVGSTNVPPGVCDGSVFKKYNPPGQTTNEAADYFNTYVKPRLTPYLISVYKEAERETGFPCEVFAGLHYIEGGSDPNLSLISGRPLGTPEPDEGNRVFATLLDTAVYVAGKIQGKVGGHIDSWQQMVTALSRYNGGGNDNCRVGVPYFNIPGHCPPLYEGEDDIYPLGWIDQKHATMYQIYCADNVLCNPPMEITRPGIMTISTDFYRSEK